MTATIPTSKKAIVVGAGPVGCLSALALAKRGWLVDLFEARPGSLTCAHLGFTLTNPYLFCLLHSFIRFTPCHLQGGYGAALH